MFRKVEKRRQEPPPAKKGEVPSVTKKCNSPNAPVQFSNNELVSLLVRGLTQGLRFVVQHEQPSSREGGGPSQGQQIKRERDTVAVIDALRSDFTEHAYFVTGNITDSIYDPDCYFADPTIGFRGLEQWKANLRLLVPFLESPSIDLVSIEVLPGTAKEMLRAGWVLKTGLRLPWRPHLVVNGSTDYELRGSKVNKKIVRHIESWDISGWEALRLVCTPEVLTWSCVSC